MAIRFDASGEMLSRTASVPSMGSATVMGWFRVAVNRAETVTFYMLQETATSEGLRVGTGFDGVSHLIYNGDFNLGTVLTVGTWYHSALAISGTGGSQVTLYLNGVSDVLTDGYPGVTAQNLTLGNHLGDEWLNGSAAAIKVWSVPLTAAEIALEMRQYLPIRTANLSGFYPLLSTVDDQVDFSGAGLTLTVAGTVATEDGPPIPWVEGRRRVLLAGSVTEPPAELGYVLVAN